MNRNEFEAFMDAESWSLTQRQQWASFSPCCDAATFRRELQKPDGLIEVAPVKASWPGLLPLCAELLGLA